MKTKSFQPQLAPNQEVNLDEIKYPVLCSTKLDGCRIIYKDGEMLTRSLKQVPNKQLQEKFQPLKDYSKQNDVILDGEIYCHGIPFQFIVSCFMTQDYEDKKAIKKWTELCKEHEFYKSREEVLNELKFHCFDYLDEGTLLLNVDFEFRYELLSNRLANFDNVVIIEQKLLNSKEEILSYFEEVLEQGYEGLIIRDPNGKYKFGRCTLNERNIYKLKPFLDFDGKIKDVIQATKVNPNAEKKINEMGYSVTSKKQEDRVLIEKACDFVVDYEGRDLKVVIALNDEQKEEIWRNKDKYIGKWITYKGMLVGSKDLVRHPVFLRFRESKD